MKETARLQKLFADLYDGDPWIDVTLLGALSAITASKAAYKPHPDWNSIWEIANHLIEWRHNVLQRVNGHAITTPAHNYFSAVSDTSDDAWRQTLDRLLQTHQAWTAFLSRLPDEELEKIYAANGHSYAEHIHGILQHDAYHLGQIVMLAKHSR